MTIDELVVEYHKRFSRHGEFCLAPEEKISVAVVKHDVPNEFGVYVISALKQDACEVVYIGRAGTIETNGRLKQQGLRQRLTKKQGGLSRNEFFNARIKAGELTGLRFQWFVTFHEKISSVIPAVAEGELIQAYFDEYSCLPNWNKSF